MKYPRAENFTQVILMTKHRQKLYRSFPPRDYFLWTKLVKTIYFLNYYRFKCKEGAEPRERDFATERLRVCSNLFRESERESRMSSLGYARSQSCIKWFGQRNHSWYFSLINILYFLFYFFNVMVKRSCFIIKTFLLEDSKCSTGERQSRYIDNS